MMARPGSSFAVNSREGRAVQDALAESLGMGVRRSVRLAEFTSIRVGGPADLLFVAQDVDKVARAVRAARRHCVPWRVLGDGCNILVADEGVRGLVIVNRASTVSLDACALRAKSGARLATVARRAIERGMGGLEWAVGLPGTVGGAVVGNAGAFGGDIAGTFRSGAVLEPGGDVVERESGWFDFEYRDSRLKRETGKNHVLLEASFDLEPADPEKLRARSEELLERRRRQQPSGPTMGSTFKNPEGQVAGRLIELAGLKGYRIGGARVSEKHANFILNAGDASAQDVLNLIRHIQAEVERQFGVKLVLEIELLGW